MYAYQRLFVDKFEPDYVLYFISNDDLNCDYTFSPLLPVTTIVDDKINTWDLKEPLDLLKMNGIDPFYWKVTNKMGHWNVKAHKAIGDFIAKKINHLYLEDTKHQNHQLQ